MTTKTLFIPKSLANRAAHYMREEGWNTITEEQISDQFVINISDDPEFFKDITNALNLAEQDRVGRIDCAPVVRR